MTNHHLRAAWSAVALLALSLSLAACSKPNPNYCEGAPNNNCAEVDAAVPSGCTSSAECAAPTAVCDVGGTATCVACTAGEASACTGTTPVCGADNTCGGCTSHAACAASDVCLPTGACADTATVAYVAPGGSGTTCTQAAPCGTLSAALLTDRAIVKFAAGVVKDTAPTVIDGRTVTILAAPGAVLDRDLDGPILEVRNANANVSVYDVEVSGATGTSGANAVQLVGNGGSPQLRLERVTVRGNAGVGITASGGTLTVTGSTVSGNQGVGITASGGTLTVTGSTVSGNQGVGITASGGTLTVTRSTLTGNQGGGLDVTGVGTSFEITNNVISYNGVATGPAATTLGGGLVAPNTPGSRFAWNTVAFNRNSGALSRGGVTCLGAMVQAPGNIVYGNTEATTTSDATQTGGSCGFGNTLALGSSATNLGFKSPLTSPFDFHLTATTPTTVLNAGGACTGDDLDGDTRPQGGACDLGADELVP